jgi:aerobic carbon-monoxide dehydrogenase medium subunit
MTLPSFDLHRPGTAEQVAELFDRYGDDAAVYCGGTELLLLLKLGFASYGHLVDIKPLAELGGIAIEDDTVAIGAAVTHRQLERSEIVKEHLPALAEMERRVANIRVRNVGTLGGNICFSDPHSDPATFLLALDASVECLHGTNSRALALSDFVLGPYQTALAPGELLARIRVPLPPAGTRIVHKKLSFHERPAATVTVAAERRENVFTSVRIGVGSVGARPVRAHEAERALEGAEAVPNDEWNDAAEAAAAASGAVDDNNGSADYKAHLVGVLVKRCLAEAVQAP